MRGHFQLFWSRQSTGRGPAPRCRFRGIAAALAALLLAVPAEAAGLRCTIASKFACNADGCAPTAITVWNEIDLERAQYGRCDAAGCDVYGAEIAGAGLMLLIELAGLGIVAKLNTQSGAFTEVATYLNSVLVSFGRCAPEDDVEEEGG